MNSEIKETISAILEQKPRLLIVLSKTSSIDITNKISSLLGKLQNLEFSNISVDQRDVANAFLKAYQELLKQYLVNPSAYSASFINKTNELDTYLSTISIKNDKKNPIDRLDEQEKSLHDLNSKFNEDINTIANEITSVSDNVRSYSKTISDLENKIAPIDTLLSEANNILTVSKEALDNAQKIKTIEYTQTLNLEYQSLESKYFWTGIVWLVFSGIILGGIIYIIFCYPVVFTPLNENMTKLFGNGFISSMYALSPFLAKGATLIILTTILGISLKLFSDYKRLTQEYRHKSLLAKNLLSGIDVLKTYIGTHVISGFVLPTIEKLLEDPMSKVYASQESTEQTLGLVQKVMEIGKTGREVASTED